MLVQILPNKFKKLMAIVLCISIKLLTLCSCHLLMKLKSLISLNHYQEINLLDMMKYHLLLSNQLLRVLLLFLYMSNLSFHHGQFPTRLKLAKVVHILKMMMSCQFVIIDQSLCFPFFAKVLEKLMFERRSIFIRIMLFSQLVNLVFVNITQRIWL